MAITNGFQLRWVSLRSHDGRNGCDVYLFIRVQAIVCDFVFLSHPMTLLLALFQMQHKKNSGAQLSRFVYIVRTAHFIGKINNGFLPRKNIYVHENAITKSFKYNNRLNDTISNWYEGTSLSNRSHVSPMAQTHTLHHTHTEHYHANPFIFSVPFIPAVYSEMYEMIWKKNNIEFDRTKKIEAFIPGRNTINRPLATILICEIALFHVGPNGIHTKMYDCAASVFINPSFRSLLAAKIIFLKISRCSGWFWSVKLESESLSVKSFHWWPFCLVHLLVYSLLYGD